MEVVCPRCGGRGLVPWDQLDKFLRCRPCAQWYLIDKSGQLVETSHPATMSVQVRSSFGGWQQATVALPQVTAPNSTPVGAVAGRRRAGLDWSWMAAIGGGVLTGLLALGLLLKPAPEEEVQAAAPLPNALEERSVVLAKAWLQKDLVRLLELTEPSRDRDLRRWIAAAPPDVEMVAMAAESLQFEVQEVKPRNAEVADVKVRIRGSGAGPGAEHLQSQVWMKRSETWFFAPPRPRMR